VLFRSPLFVRAWEKMREEGTFEKYDWVVKVNADTVFFPDRLKSLLKQRGESPRNATFFANCQAADKSYSVIGALELFSVEAAKAYFKGADRCETLLRSDKVEETGFISKCMNLLEVDMATDFKLLRDGDCNTNNVPVFPCIDNDAVAFHPMPSPSEYFTCWGQASQHFKDAQVEAAVAAKASLQLAQDLQAEEREAREFAEGAFADKGEDKSQGKSRHPKVDTSKSAKEDRSKHAKEEPSKPKAESAKEEDTKSKVKNAKELEYLQGEGKHRQQRQQQDKEVHQEANVEHRPEAEHVEEFETIAAHIMETEQVEDSEEVAAHIRK